MPGVDDQPGTAIVTGAASGIGAAFAQRLSGGQRRLVLVDRNVAGLESLADSLARSSRAEVLTIGANLARPEDQDRVVECIEREDELRLLVNNAGFGDPSRFHEQDPQVQLDMLQVHVVSTVRFCRAVLPGMIDRRRGDIVNVSSMAAELTVAGNVMYGSTKGFLRTFSEILRFECSGTGVNVQLLCPGYTLTAFHETPYYEEQNLGRIPGWLWSSPESVANASLRALVKRRFVCVPGFWNRWMHFSVRSRLVPNWVIRLLLA